MNTILHMRELSTLWEDIIRLVVDLYYYKCSDYYPCGSNMVNSQDSTWFSVWCGLRFSGNTFAAGEYPADA